MVVTLLELRTDAKQRADMERSNFVSESEWNSYINSSLAELHDIMIASYEDYDVSESTFATVQSQAAYDLPANFYKARGVDVKIQGASSPTEWCTITKFNFNERNRYAIQGFWDYPGVPYLRYRLVGAKIQFSPVPDRATDVKLWYNPILTKLVVDTDEYNDTNGFAEYVVVDAAIKALNKEESDVTVLMAQKAALKLRITSMSQNRDAGSPEAVSDIYAENDDYIYTGGS